MSSKIIEEHKPGIWRAIRNAQRVLLRNDLDPFEFVVEIHETPLGDQRSAYVLEISTADGVVSIRKPGLPHECIEGGREMASDGLARFVQGLVPELLAAMKAARRTLPRMSPATLSQG